MQVNTDPSDGVNRSVPLVVEMPNDDAFVPSLSLAAVMRYRGSIRAGTIVRPNGVQIGDRFVPTDDAKSMLLNFSPGCRVTSRVISAADVLAGTVREEEDRGQDRARRRDRLRPWVTERLAPVNKSSDVPGVLLHANAVNTMLTGTYLDPVSDSQTLLWVARASPP